MMAGNSAPLAITPLAILGATSQIACDFIATLAGRRPLRLYARSPDRAQHMLAARGIAAEPIALDRFGETAYGGIVNFIGIGDPSRTAALGTGILDATRIWDERALAHLETQPDIPYVFLSSGAVYGEDFAQPITRESLALVPINALGPRNWYALAKLIAEAGHRARPDRTILDIRVFNYISSSLDVEARFLMSDMIRAIVTGTVMETSAAPMVRDYLHPVDCAALIEAALAAPLGTNGAIDAYTRAPIDKGGLLSLMSERFGLRYRVVPVPDVVNATGLKRNYYSLNHAAADLDYRPSRSSTEAIIDIVSMVLSKNISLSNHMSLANDTSVRRSA